MSKKFIAFEIAQKTEHFCSQCDYLKKTCDSEPYGERMVDRISYECRGDEDTCPGVEYYADDIEIEGFE